MVAQCCFAGCTSKSANKIEMEELFQSDKTELTTELGDASVEIPKVFLNKREQNVLYKISCYILYKISISKVKLHCDVCLSQCRRQKINGDKPYTLLMGQPNLQYDSTASVVYVKDEVFKHFLLMEKIFRTIHPILAKKEKFNLHRLITNNILDLAYDCGISNCHNLQKTLTNRFVTFRLKNSGVQRNKRRKFNFSSHSIN